MVTIRLADVLDIAVITVLLYFGIQWIHSRASRSFVVGIGGITALYIGAQRFDMYLTSWLFQAGFTALLVSLVVVFQSDIRRAIEKLTTWSAIRVRRQNNRRFLTNFQSTDTIIETVRVLAEDKVGALIVIQGREMLDRHIRGGISLHGRISFPLLYGLFNTQAPTHDGAVIIEGETIEKYAVYLPLSQHLKEGAEAGTRHAAGLGLSEVSDALVIIVSEERGTISVAEHGKLTILSSAAALKERLDRFEQHLSPRKEHAISFSWMHKNLGVKILSLVLACSLWLFFAYRAETIHRTFKVPVEWRNMPDHFSIVTPEVTEARVTMSGSERSLNFDSKSLLMSLDLDNIQEGYQELHLSENSLLNKPSGLSVNKIDPPVIRVHAYKLEDVMLPVKVRFANRLAGNLMIKNISIDNDVVKAAIPLHHRDEYPAIYTEAVDLQELMGSASMRLKLMAPELVQLPGNGPSTVKVTIEIIDKKAKH